jgi:hypothetical protein
MNTTAGSVAIVWRGDAEARRDATVSNNRFFRVFEELASLGIAAEPAVYSEEMAEEVRAQLLKVDGVLAWVDPIPDGRDRTALNALLCDVASRGPWVSAHPDVISKMGVKEVLYRTRHLGWGADTHLYSSMDDFSNEFPDRLSRDGPRVLKQNRGNGGHGVWRVERSSSTVNGRTWVSVLHARKGSVTEEMPLEEFIARCEPLLDSRGCIVDQPFQPRLADGMVRCYMGTDKVVGFGHQFIKALMPPPPEGPDSVSAQPGPRIMHAAAAKAFQDLRERMEREWTPQLMALLDIDVKSLPVIWDADFLYGPRTEAGKDTFVLCEINVSSVFPIPDQAPAAIARLVAERLRPKATR